MRRLLFAVAVAASFGVLLLWAAGVDWRSPLSPDAERHVVGAELRPVFGSAAVRAGRLRVEATGADFSALQSAMLPDVPARDFPILRYRFADFPRTLELSLMFRTAEDPDDVQTVSLPWPGEGVATFDLSRVPAWRGTIVELGFAEFATAQLVPPALGFEPFEIGDAELWSPSWHGDLAALATDWFGAWPWSQRSVHALGREGDAPRARSMVLTLAIAAGLAVLWGTVLLRWRGRQLAAALLACGALAWFALDLRWQGGLLHRLQATRTLYADVDWPRRSRIVGDSDILAAADELRALLAARASPARVLVAAGSRYQLLRLIWHLLPLNVGEFAFAAATGVPLPEGSLIAFFDDDSWHSDPSVRALLAHSERLHAAGALHANGFDEQRLVVFRYRHAH
jgi:hypothetical protein